MSLLTEYTQQDTMRIEKKGINNQRNHREMRKIVTLKKNEEMALRALKKALSKNFHLTDFRLFGSKARGDDTPDSDIDVMIELAELSPAIESKIYDLVFAINLKYDSFISVIIFSKKEIEEGPMSESPIYRVIQSEGIPL